MIELGEADHAHIIVMMLKFFGSVVVSPFRLRCSLLLPSVAASALPVPATARCVLLMFKRGPDVKSLSSEGSLRLDAAFSWASCEPGRQPRLPHRPDPRRTIAMAAVCLGGDSQWPHFGSP